MAKIHLDIVTAERSVLSEDVDVVIAPGVEGEMAILPHHTPLMTTLKAGELRARNGTEEYALAVSGGFLEVRPDRVTVLADSAERAEEIDIARADAARRAAEAHVAEKYLPAESQAALARAMVRLRVAQRRRHVGSKPGL